MEEQGNMKSIFKIDPVAKPRMTQRDRWLYPPRRCVSRYYAFKDIIAALGMDLPVSGAYVSFKIQMPKSWSKKKKAVMEGQPHQQVPDLDNLLKALLDSVYSNDSVVWQISAEKRWAKKGSIIIEY